MTYIFGAEILPCKIIFETFATSVFQKIIVFENLKSNIKVQK